MNEFIIVHVSNDPNVSNDLNDPNVSNDPNDLCCVSSTR